MAEFSVEYSIDDQNRLVSFNENWDPFALQNSSAHLVAENISGQSLFEHISGEELSQLWRYIIDGVRKRQSSAEFDFRCDSPDFKRFMRMRVWHQKDRVVFTSTLLRTKAASGLKIFDVKPTRSKLQILACSWCKSIKAGETLWLEPEIAVERMQLLEHDHPPEISHGICPVCYSRVWDDFERQLKS
jgi:hypothetical protein